MSHRRNRLRIEQLTQRLANQERRQSGDLDDARHVAATVEQLEDRWAIVAKVICGDQVCSRNQDLSRARNALADVGPLIDATSSLHDDAVAVEEEPLIDRAIATFELLGVLVELELGFVAEEKIVDLLFQLDAILLVEFSLVQIPTGEQTIGKRLRHAHSMVTHFVDGFFGEPARAHKGGHDPVQNRVHVVVCGDATLVEVQNLPQLGGMDAQEADLLVKGEHLKHLGQIYTGKIPS